MCVCVFGMVTDHVIAIDRHRSTLSLRSADPTCHSILLHVTVCMSVKHLCRKGKTRLAYVLYYIPIGSQHTGPIQSTTE